MSENDYSQCEPRLKLHYFKTELLQQDIYFHVIQMDQSLFIWIGSNPAKMADLAVAITNKFVS